MSGSELPDEGFVDDWRRITTGVRWAERRVDQVLEDSGVPAQWFAVLYMLLHSEDHRSPMSALAREVSMTSGGFTKLADRMAREGLIDRRGSVDDRRVVHASLTADGLIAARKATRLYQDALRECLLDVVSVDDLASAAATMAALRAVRDQGEHADEVFATDDAVLADRRGRGPATD